MSSELPTQTITIDETTHDVSSLSKDQQSIVNAINKCDVDLEDLKHKMAITQTARQAYVNDLGDQLKEE
jgi:hypothetical protein|tara:strand:- start:684 stop:890 length:207 start_codon:yes stop_codon:yes gene_type:complete